MFDSWSAWAWIAAAWFELILAYGGYLLYLRWRAKRVEKAMRNES